MKKIFFGLIFSLLAFQANAYTINLASDGAADGFFENQPFDETHQLNLDSSIATWDLDFSIQDISLNSTGRFGLQIIDASGSVVATVTPPSSTVTLAAGKYTMKFIGAGGTGGTMRVQGTAVSGVPVPAAVWLFGSALMGLVGASRRKATPQAVVA